MHRQALRAWLLSPGHGLRRRSSPRDVWSEENKVMAGGTPANPATLELVRLFPLRVVRHLADRQPACFGARRRAAPRSMCGT
jgi:hypothetical protein